MIIYLNMTHWECQAALRILLIGASFEVLVNCHGDIDRLNYPILVPIIIKMFLDISRIEKNL